MGDRVLLAFGQFRKREQIELSLIAQEAALELSVAESAERALELLDQKMPLALLVDDTADDSEGLCLRTRGHATQARTPIISLAREIDDLTFAEVFNWGGDDVVRLTSMWPLLSRLRLLPRQDAAPPSNNRGVAVVADPDRARRVIRARVLKNAGWAIRFAQSADELRAAAETADTTLMVVDADLEGAAEELRLTASAHPKVAHILLCPPRQIAEFTETLGLARNAVVADGFAPPENVIFLANEIERGGASDKRAHKRLLYGTRVRFRGEGRDVDDYGFSFNISAGGLYVRTLAPPKDDRVWIELKPPRCDRWVRLEGDVVWRRAFGPADNATVPPGFGVKLVDATRSSMQAWLTGYREFQQTMHFEPTASAPS